MSSAPHLSNRPQWDNLHPAIWKVLLGSMLTVVVAIWLAFGSSPEAALQVAVSTAFAAVFVATPLFLWNAGGRKGVDGSISFREWLHGEFQTWTGVMPAGEAATMVLLVPVAVAAGMTGICFVAYAAAHGWI